MRNLVIESISNYLRIYTDLMYELDIAPDELDKLSNAELLTLLQDIFELIYTDNPSDDI